MKDQHIRQRFVELFETEETNNDLTKPLLELALALHAWSPYCICKIECGATLQDANYAGEIVMLISDNRGVWQVAIRISWFGMMITFIDESKVITRKQETELEHLFERQGFLYAPHRLLLEKCPSEEYDTWFDYYFSWV